MKILHRSAKEDPIILKDDGVEWKTCLRTIIFHPSQRPATHTGEAAYEFLLQVICGLKSPMIGETEILAQFKGFLKRHPNTIAPKISNKLIQDSKKIRTKYLKNYGCQSYGSIALKESKDYQEILLLGAGALSQDIVPIIKGFAGQITIAARNLEKAKKSFQNYSDIKIIQLDDIGLYDKTLVVIAAPLKSEMLFELLNSSFSKSSILDMRSTRDGESLKLNNEFKYKCLSEIFQEIEQTQNNLKSLSKKIELEIEELSKEWTHKTQIRPFGWEDLCY